MGSAVLITAAEFAEYQKLKLAAVKVAARKKIYMRGYMRKYRARKSA